MNDTVSRLLIQEPPLQVLPSLAVKIGLNEAIFLQQLHYWTQGKSGKEIDGHRWVYNTYEQWQEQFPFWSERTIRRIINGLEKNGIVISSTEMNKMKMDNTKWYAINYEAIHGVNLTTQSGQLDQANTRDNIRELRSTHVERAISDEKEEYEHEQDDGKVSEPPRDFGGDPGMKPIDVHGWWYDFHELPYPKVPDGREMRAAKHLIDRGFGGAEWLEDLYTWIQSDPFWKAKGITLSVMDSRATAYLATHKAKTNEPTSMETYLGSNAYRLERLKRKEFITQIEHLRYNNIPNGERWLAEDIALLEQRIETEREGSPS